MVTVSNLSAVSYLRYELPSLLVLADLCGKKIHVLLMEECVCVCDRAKY